MKSRVWHPFVTGILIGAMINLGLLPLVAANRAGAQGVLPPATGPVAPLDPGADNPAYQEIAGLRFPTEPGMADLLIEHLLIRHDLLGLPLPERGTVVDESWVVGGRLSDELSSRSFLGPGDHYSGVLYTRRSEHEVDFYVLHALTASDRKAFGLTEQMRLKAEAEKIQGRIVVVIAECRGCSVPMTLFVIESVDVHVAIPIALESQRSAAMLAVAGAEDINQSTGDPFLADIHLLALSDLGLPISPDDFYTAYGVSMQNTPASGRPGIAAFLSARDVDPNVLQLGYPFNCDCEPKDGQPDIPEGEILDKLEELTEEAMILRDACVAAANADLLPCLGLAAGAGATGVVAGKLCRGFPGLGSARGAACLAAGLAYIAAATLAIVCWAKYRAALRKCQICFETRRSLMCNDACNGRTPDCDLADCPG